MNRRQLVATITAAALALPLCGRAENQSLKNEVSASISKGVLILKSLQDKTTGSWGETEATKPAYSALAATALVGDPARAKELPAEIQQALDYIVSCQQADGGIYTEKFLGTYGTALGLTAMSLAGGEKWREPALKARRYLAGQQADFDKKGEGDSPFDGGIGYTKSSPNSDLSNTHFALEALYYSKNLFADQPDAEKAEPQLNWDAAIQFVSRCQQLKQTNDQEWVDESNGNKGGFIYRPGESKVETEAGPDGKKPLRAYGSMSYAGLLSFIYAEMDMKDPRILAVMEWLKANYSLEENPGMGQQGLYYYYHTMAKALSLAKVDKFKTADGKEVDWRADLSAKLFNLQSKDGSWSNENGRWMEKDVILSTAYAVLTLEYIHRGL